ncbi:MAG: hypothetical protein CL878_15645 [Dehalococcoidia bacterium]|nr:hypothetical protein [Dehalococcoidia bacterium]
MRASLDDWPLLEDHTVKLFRAIARYRPSIEDRLDEVVDQLRVFDHAALERTVEASFELIEETFSFVDGLLARADDSTLAEELRYLATIEAYRRIYTHANYWQILLDQVFLEGAFEHVGLEFLQEVSAQIGRGVVELLQDLIDPATRRYTVPEGDAQVAQALEELRALLGQLERSSAGGLAERLQRFVTLYGLQKSWQLRYQQFAWTKFQQYIPDAHQRIVAVSTAVGVEIPDEAKPWDLLDIIEDGLLPAVMRRYGQVG